MQTPRKTGCNVCPAATYTEAEYSIKEACPVCSEKINITLGCSHAFCLNCLIKIYAQAIVNKVVTPCPMCRENIFYCTNPQALKKLLKKDPLFRAYLAIERSKKEKDRLEQIEADREMAQNLDLYRELAAIINYLERIETERVQREAKAEQDRIEAEQAEQERRMKDAEFKELMHESDLNLARLAATVAMGEQILHDLATLNINNQPEIPIETSPLRRAIVHVTPIPKRPLTINLAGLPH